MLKKWGVKDRECVYRRKAIEKKNESNDKD